MRPLALLSLTTLVVASCRPDATEPLTPPLAPPPSLDATLPAPTEQEALDISANIQAVHWPYHTLLNPRYATGDSTSPDFMKLDSEQAYTQAADNAIWTGHYLAAEALRHRVTGSAEALAYARKALDGLTALVDVTGTDLLSRFLIPRSSPYADAVLEHSSKHGIYDAMYNGELYGWLGNTSRDQYSGAFFGLGVAYDMIADEDARKQIRSTVGRMLDFLIKNDWYVRMPDGTISTTFFGRYDQQLSFLQVGRRVDPTRWDRTYKTYRSKYANQVGTPISTECTDPHGSYYKFNLDHINLYNLIRLEEAGTYKNAYMKAFNTLRSSSCTGTHQNAHFNMIEHGLKGASSGRDAETRELLSLWLTRSRRDYFVDNRGKYEACDENRACQPIPVDDRYNTDFLWQRSPFQLYGGEEGRIPTPAVDYILPYWMARYYGVLTN